MKKFLMAFCALGVAFGYSFAAPYESRQGNLDNNNPEVLIAASDHFEIRVKDHADDGTKNTVSISANDEKVQKALEYLETAWTYFHEKVGFREPFEGEAHQYKTRAYVFQAGVLDALYGGEDGWGPGIWIGEGSLSDYYGLTHEYTHGLQSNAGGIGNTAHAGWIYESHANWMAHQVYSDNVHCSEDLVNYPYLYFGSTRDRYCNWQYFEYFKDTHGGELFNSIWSKSLRGDDQKEQTPFTALMHVTGWDLKQLNTDFGAWAMKNVTWDYSNGAVYRKNYGDYEFATRRTLGWQSDWFERHGRVTMLDKMNDSANRYISPSYWAPQRYGYNIVRIYPDKAGEITLKFRGVLQKKNVESYDCIGNLTDWYRDGRHNWCNLQPDKLEDPASSWEFGLVAVEADGSPRYSKQYSGTSADIKFEVKENDKALYLVVLAAPTKMQTILWDQFYYTIYRYPYMVELENAKPEGFEEGAWLPKNLSGYTKHANGGGYVSSRAKVDASVYVAPNAVVNGGTITGNVRIEDFAVVDAGTISGEAIIRGRAYITGNNTKISDNAIVEEDAWVQNSTVSGNAKIGALTFIANSTVKENAQVYSVMRPISGKSFSGTGQVRGDMENNYSREVNAGVYYGIIGDADLTNRDFGYGRTDAALEVTAPIDTATWWGDNTTKIAIPQATPIHMNIHFANNTLQVQGVSRIEIFDTKGTKQFSKSTNETSDVLKLNLSAGNYFVRGVSKHNAKYQMITVK